MNDFKLILENQLPINYVRSISQNHMCIGFASISFFDRSSYKARSKIEIFSNLLDPHQIVSNPREHYDEMGIDYANRNATSLANAFYERPTMISLLPELQGLNVVDAGCGSGTLTEYLVQKGAKVIGFDVSEVLIGYTKHKLSENPNCLIRVADFSQPLDFIADESIDLVVSSLVLHYIEDWRTTLSEVTKILKEHGEFIFSIHHPLVDWKIAEMSDYFNFELIEDVWTIDEKKYKVQFYHRTLSNVFEAIQRSGLYVDSLFEPKLVPEGRSLDEDWFNYLEKNPQFLFLKLKKL